MEYLLDSYVWLEYFADNGAFARYVESETNYTASVSLTEVIRAMLRRKIDGKTIERHLRFMQKKSVILPVDEATAMRAGYLAEEHGLHFSDALIYALSSSERKVVTGDAHFKGKPNVEFLE